MPLTSRWLPLWRANPEAFILERVVLEDGNDHIIEQDELCGSGDLEASLLVHLSLQAAPYQLA